MYIRRTQFRYRVFLFSVSLSRSPSMLLVLLFFLIGCSPDEELKRQADRLKQTAVAEAQKVAATQTASLKQTAIALEKTVAAKIIGGSRNGYQSPNRGKVKIGVYRPKIDDHTGRDLYAVDYLQSDDLTIYPTRPGKVVFSGWNCETKSGKPPCYGNVVAIDHGEGIYSIYAHLQDKGLPSVGSAVDYDTPIGTMSDSGCPDCGVHLHFAVHKGKTGLTDRMALWGANEPVNIWQEIAGLKDCFPMKKVCETTMP